MSSKQDKALVTIKQEQDTELPDPSSYSVATTTMTDGGTSVNGYLLSSIVRDNVAQISLSWSYLDAYTWSWINELFKDNYINMVEFYDQVSDCWVKREMYISDRSAGLWRRDEDGKVLGWTGCSLQLTEA